MLMVHGKGNIPWLEKVKMFATCSSDQDCYAVFPEFIHPDLQFSILGSLLRIFADHSSSLTIQQQEKFIAKRPVAFELKPGTKYEYPGGTPVHLKLNIEPYHGVPFANALGEVPDAYSERRELAALFVGLKRLRTFKEEEIQSDSDVFRQMMNDHFHAEYAADLHYGINRSATENYEIDVIDAALFVKTIRSWESIKPLCSMRHGGTVYIYLRAKTAEGQAFLQVFPVSLTDEYARFDAIRFADNLIALLQAPDVLSGLERSNLCGAKDSETRQ